MWSVLRNSDKNAIGGHTGSAADLHKGVLGPLSQLGSVCPSSRPRLSFGLNVSFARPSGSFGVCLLRLAMRYLAQSTEYRQPSDKDTEAYMRNFVIEEAHKPVV